VATNMKSIFIYIFFLFLAACGGDDTKPANNSQQDTNTPPVISGAPTISVTQNSSYSFTPTASDADGDNLSFSVSNNLPSWLSFNSTTGTISGTPGAANIGTTPSIVISVSDGTHTTPLDAFSITVSPITATGQFNFSSSSYSVTEGQTVTVTISRTNSSGQASVSYGTQGVSAVHTVDYVGASWTELVFLNGESSKTVQFQTIDDALVENDETFEVQLSQPSTGWGLGSTPTTTVNITNNDTGPANSAPSISGTPPAVASVGTVYSFTPVASDADADNLTFTATGVPSWLSFNPSNGSITGTPSAANLGATTTITITVSDGQASTSLPGFTIDVVAGSATGSATISWTPPTTNADGSALTDLAGYRIYYGTSPGNMTTSVTVNNIGLTSFVVNNLLVNSTYYFSMTAVDTSGNESSLSNTMSHLVQ